MANIGRTGKQKLLLVISIITLVFAIIAIISGILLAVGGGVIAAQGGVSTTDASISQSDATVAAVGGGLIIVSAIFSLLAGIFGIRGSKNANKIMAFIVISIISAVLTLVGVITNFDWSNLVTLIIDVLLVVLGFAIKGDPNSQRF